MANPKYIDVPAQRKAKQADWLIAVAELHTLLDSAGISRGDGNGAYTLYFRIGLLIERADAAKQNLREARAAIRAHVDECNDVMADGESVPDFARLSVWLRKADKLKLGERS